MSRTSSERRRSRLRLGWIATLLGLLLGPATGCATLSIADEQELGRRFEAEIAQEVHFLRDETVVRYVESIGQRVLAAAGPQPFEYRFYVVRDPEINAFAAPAGHIYVHTGTVLKARNVSELAGVIGHEVGHVALRHIANNYNRQRWTGIGHQVLVTGAGMWGGQAAAGAANLLGGLAAVSYLNTFGRDAERAADGFAVRVLPQAGYDPEGLVSFFHTLRTEAGGGPPAFLSSHPAPDERIQNTRRLIDEQGRVPGLAVNDRGRLEIIQRRIQLLTGSPGERGR